MAARDGQARRGAVKPATLVSVRFDRRATTGPPGLHYTAAIVWTSIRNGS